MNPLIQGLEISITGLAVTFTALGIFILVMMALQRIFREKTPVDDETSSSDESIIETSTVVVAQSSDEETDLIAVIAVAISYFRLKTLSSLGTSLETGKGTWWISNRLNAKQGTGITIKRSGKA